MSTTRSRKSLADLVKLFFTKIGNPEDVVVFEIGDTSHKRGE